MQRNWTDTPLYAIADWIMKLAYINLLWLLFMFAGLIVFGFMPATVAMFTVIRKMLLKENSMAVFRTFWTVFRQEFLKSNLAGLILLTIGYVLYVDFMYLGIVQGHIHTLLAVGLALVGIWYLAVMLMIVPVYVHYDLKLFKYFKQSFLMALTNPHIVIFGAFLIFVAYRIFNFIPGLTLFFFGSVISLIMMWSAMLAFKRAELKQEKLQEKETARSLFSVKKLH